MMVAHALAERVRHEWLRPMRVAFVTGVGTGGLAGVLAGLTAALKKAGHELQAEPKDDTDLILTTAAWGKPVPWRQSLLFSARRRFGLTRAPTVVTLLQATAEQLQDRLEELAAALSQPLPSAKDFVYPGLTERAHRVLREQGQRGGPILALVRLVQSQALSIRDVLIIGRDRPEAAYYFDLVGAYPRVECGQAEAFFDDMVLRLATAVSTQEVVEHEFVLPEVPAATWRAVTAPAAMQRAAEELGRRHFFTEMVRIADLVDVPALHDAVAAQYSEGCFATWDPELDGLVSTVTGSARPVDKGRITEDDLAVIVGVRPDGRGALVRAIEGRPPTSPSSEAVEMMLMDDDLPRHALDGRSNGASPVPVLRSKLHGHRGVAAFDPRQVEFVPLDPAYYDYPVSCGTQAQAQAIREAFRRSQSLRTLGDPRRIVFTVLPGHGVVMGETWSSGKAPFQVLWEAMDSGVLELVSEVPQGRYSYRSRGPERQELVIP